MEIKHITSDSLRRLLSLTEKKEQLIKAVADVESEIAKALSGAATTAVEVVEAVTPFKPKAVKAQKTRKGGKVANITKTAGTGRRGSLKDRILAVLEAAGSQGMRVKEIADALGVKAGNVSVWFSTTGKKFTQKVQPGRYTILQDSSAPIFAEASVEKSPKAARRAKRAKASKAAKPSKSSWGASKTPGKTKKTNQ